MNPTLAFDIDVLNLAIDMGRDSQLKKNILKQQLQKKIKRHGYQALYNVLQFEMRYRLAATRVFLGDFSNWTGWIYRSERAAERYWISQPIKRWDGKPCKRLLVIGEQGVGDEILWASCLPDCQRLAEQVIYACDKRLIGMLSRSMPDIEFVEQRTEDYERTWPEHIPDADFFIPAADLLPMFRKRRGDFTGPYLLTDAGVRCETNQVSGRIGIGWSGRNGSFDPLRLGIEKPISLQHDAQKDGIEAPPIDLHNDLDAVLSLVSSLERVVCVPSTLHHICGAAGVACDVIWPEVLGIDEEYGELSGLVPWSHPPGVLPWYPSVTVYKTIDQWKRSRQCTARVETAMSGRRTTKPAFQPSITS